MIQTFFHDNTFNTPSWSISAEYYTYMIFALILFFMKRTNLLIFISLVSILVFRLNSDISLGIEKTYLSFLDCESVLEEIIVVTPYALVCPSRREDKFTTSPRTV